MAQLKPAFAQHSVPSDLVSSFPRSPPSVTKWRISLQVPSAQAGLSAPGHQNGVFHELYLHSGLLLFWQFHPTGKWSFGLLLIFLFCIFLCPHSPPSIKSVITACVSLGFCTSSRRFRNALTKSRPSTLSTATFPVSYQFPLFTTF